MEQKDAETLLLPATMDPTPKKRVTFLLPTLSGHKRRRDGTLIPK